MREHVRRLIESLKGLEFDPYEAEEVVAEVRLRIRRPQDEQQTKIQGLINRSGPERNPR